MSGGSYDYLCFKDSQEILNMENTLSRMADRFIELKCDGLAKETITILHQIKRYKLNMEVKLNAISDYWRAVEWLDSGDTGLEDTIEKLNEFKE